jgi:hypothetical protein
MTGAYISLLTKLSWVFVVALNIWLSTRFERIWFCRSFNIALLSLAYWMKSFKLRVCPQQKTAQKTVVRVRINFILIIITEKPSPLRPDGFYKFNPSPFL